jgi:hypothetical protein
MREIGGAGGRFKHELGDGVQPFFLADTTQYLTLYFRGATLVVFDRMRKHAVAICVNLV